jgi:hypothetical protein
MQLRLRQLVNDEWAVEAKRFMRPWCGIYISRGVNTSLKDLRFISYSPFGDTGYASFCLHKEHHKALSILNEIKAMLGLEK